MEPFERDPEDGLSDFEREICHAIDSGLSDRAAYRKVDPFSKESDTAAAFLVWNLRRRPHCASYLASLKAKTLERHLDAKDRVIAELAALAFANVGDFLTRGPDGLAVRPMDELPPELFRAVSDITITRTGQGGAVRLRMHPKQPALKQLCKLFGLEERIAREFDLAARGAAMSDVERAQRLVAMLRLAKRHEDAAADAADDAPASGPAQRP